jgi:uncharacterized protein YecE (DUF72 family)
LQWFWGSPPSGPIFADCAGYSRKILAGGRHAAKLRIEMAGSIHIGTSGWSYDDWVGPFYPAGTKPGDYLAYYAQRYHVVEVDSTFYRAPSARMVSGWATRVPEQFGFALKMPRTITHEKILAGCDAEMKEILPVFGLLGFKLRSVLLQFGYFNRSAFSGPKPFLERLAAFFARYADQLPLACEIRNKNWLTDEYFALLRKHHVAAALVEHAWLPPIDALIEQCDVITGPYVYVRLIGDREGIEKITTTWDKEVVDRTADLRRIAGTIRRIAQQTDVYTFVNNHYAGHGPATCRALREACAQALNPEP